MKEVNCMDDKSVWAPDEHDCLALMIRTRLLYLFYWFLGYETVDLKLHSRFQSTPDDVNVQ